MGSALGPVLANIIMTELEKHVVDRLFCDGVIKFYVRYVDDTLVLAKPSSFAHIQSNLNSFHPQLKFTLEHFSDDVHFLDILIKSDHSLSIYRKSTHTGQYVHFDSFEPWHIKIAWIRSLVSRAYKICSDGVTLADGLLTFKRFLAWNGYPKTIASKLLQSFIPKFGPVNQKIDEKLPIIFMSLPYIGKYGEKLARKCSNKIKRLTDKPIKIQIHWQTTKVSFFTNSKDRTAKDYCSSVVYKFTCPGCNTQYIGKTDRNLVSRIKEHAKGNSEIFIHTNSCADFNYLYNMVNLPCAVEEYEPIQLYEFIMSNTKIIDKDKHWSLLLFKEALAIRRNDPALNHGLKASKELVLFR